LAAPDPDARVEAVASWVHDLAVKRGDARFEVVDLIVDEAKVAAYAKLAGPALEGAGGAFVARGLPEQTYEAGERTRTVIIEFDSVEGARNAHDTPAYQEALAALDDGAVRDMRILPGL
jgi:uncharacterized protein (DUF1330 family)